MRGGTGEGGYIKSSRPSEAGFSSASNAGTSGSFLVADKKRLVAVSLCRKLAYLVSVIVASPPRVFFFYSPCRLFFDSEVTVMFRI